MALTIEQTQKSSMKRKAKAQAAPTAARAKKTISAKSAAPKAKRAKASVRKNVKPWSQTAHAAPAMEAEAFQKWMDVMIDKVFERPLPAFIDKADVKKQSEKIVEIVERGQVKVQEIRQKNPVLNELIEVAQKQLKKAQSFVQKK